MFNTHLDYLICEYMVYCRSRQLRAKTMSSYEQGLRLFERWCQEQMGVHEANKITENMIRRYINELQERGKYTFYCNDRIFRNGPKAEFPIEVLRYHNLIVHNGTVNRN